MSDPSFALVTCAHGAQNAVKDEVIHQGWRLAFSRPGFVTLKHDAPGADLPRGVFVRTSARSLGSIRSGHSAELIDGLRDAIEQINEPADHLHLWPRDRVPVGKFGFEPGSDEVTAAVAGAISNAGVGLPINRVAADGQRVVDCVMIDPDHWFFGTHVASSIVGGWPGGVQPIDPPSPPVSRAYYKAAEAIAWAGWEIRSGDAVVEIGSAPGGACQYLLERGLRVTGIDPGDMDEEVLEHPHFRHLRARAGDLPRQHFAGTRWLLVDSNVVPDATFTTIENIVTHRAVDIEAMLVTLKLGRYVDADRIAGHAWRVRQMGARRVAVRQLARNRMEVCLAAWF